MKQLIAFLLFLFVTIQINAQKHEFGLGVGATNYKGDFTNDNFELKNFLPAAILYYKNNITPAFGMRYHFLAGGIKATDSKSKDPVYNQRDQSFTNIIYEGALQIEYNFLNYRSPSNKLKWTPYFIGGLGIFYFSPYSNSTSTTIQPCIPVGAGFRFSMKENWNVSVELAARKTFTDLLDNTSGNVKGGNNDTNDWYIYNGFTLSYTFYDVYCPKR
jgi:Domain of unknown function (DUF6089)